MANNQVGRVSSDFLKTGKAKLYAALINASGQLITPIKDIGNLESANLGVERETNSVTTGEDDNASPARTFSRISSATLNVVCRTHNPFVTIWNMQSEITNFLQPAIPAGTYEDDLVYVADDSFILPHQNINGISSITDAAGGNPLTRGTHYAVDEAIGLVKIFALPEGVDSILGVKVNYTASEMTVDSYNGFSLNGVLCKMWLRETAEGPKGIYEIFRGRVNKDGESGIIDADSQDPLTAGFAIDIESDSQQPAPGLFRYTKLVGSL